MAAPSLALAQAPKKKPAAPTIVVNDVHAQLGSSRVYAQVQPDSLDGVRQAIALARAEQKNVCIAGGRHAMGGQAFAYDGVLVDARKLDRILRLDPERGLVEVEAGITWPELLEGLLAAQRGRDPVWTFAQKQAGADRFTLGGSAAANIHGRGLAAAPLIADIESFRLLSARGQVVNCSRTENAEIFRATIGGYGLLGFMHTLTLRLVPRRRLERIVEVRSVEGLVDAFAARVAEGCTQGEFVLDVDEKSAGFLHHGALVCYKPAAEDVLLAIGQTPTVKELLEHAWLAHTDKAAAFERTVARLREGEGKAFWSDEVQMNPYVENYHREIDKRAAAPVRSTDAISEVFCERGRLEALLADARETARRIKLELVQASVRLVEEDRESLLAWARKPWACVEFHLHVEHGTSGAIRAGDHFRRLVDLAVRHGGSYHPAYNRHALREQVEACHPRLLEFLRVKRRHDPQELWQSDWYRHYRRMFFGDK